MKFFRGLVDWKENNIAHHLPVRMGELPDNFEQRFEDLKKEFIKASNRELSL